jgi:RNA polymerase sigma factor (sigma-70 family)
MADPRPPRALRGGARRDELLVQRLLFDALWSFVWRVLSRYHLADADREDIAQNVVIAAWRYRASYSGDRGTPEQWICRIVRNTVAAFLTRRGQDPLAFAVDKLPDVPGEGLEENMSLCDIANLVFRVLPDDERRAVIAIAIEGRTLREAAASEGVSPSTVHERYERGIAALRAAVERSEQKALFSLPFLIARANLDAPGGGSDPPPELLEEAWQRAVVELGLDRSPDSDPPESGTHRREAESAQPRARSMLLRLVGPLVGALVGALLAAALLRGCRLDAPQATATPVVAVPAPSSIDRGTSVSYAAPPFPTMSPPAVIAERAPSAPAANRPARRFHDDLDADRSMLDSARTALITGDTTKALAMLMNHTRHFPDSPNAAMRARIMAIACATSGEAAADVRCAAP